MGLDQHGRGGFVLEEMKATPNKCWLLVVEEVHHQAEAVPEPYPKPSKVAG